MMLSIHDFHYSSDAPYPPIKAESGNPAYARVMLDNIGGSNSEMSAISLYVFNQLITGYNPDVSAVFHKVSIVEMHHLEIFGKLASSWERSRGCGLSTDVRRYTGPPATTSIPEICGP